MGKEELLDTLSDHLQSVLLRYPSILRPCTAPEPLGNAGGGSGARLWRFYSGRGPLVARAWPPDGPERSAIEVIHRWLREAGRVGFVPVPLPALDGRTLQEQDGRLWEVAPWLAGRAEREQPPARARLRAGFAALAAFHQSLAHHRSTGPSPGLVARLREIETLCLGDFDAIDVALNQAPIDHSSGAARRWLVLARWTAPRLIEPMRRAAGQVVERQPCLRDARPDHLLFEGDRLTGLVDFGAMGIESVSADLARLLAEWVGPDRAARAEGLAAYSSVRHIDATETGLIEAFESSMALLGAGHWVNWHFIEGRAFDDPSAVTRGIERGLERLARLALDLPN